MVLGTADGGRYCNLLNVSPLTGQRCERSHKRYPRPFTAHIRDRDGPSMFLKSFSCKHSGSQLPLNGSFSLSFIVHSFGPGVPSLPAQYSILFPFASIPLFLERFKVPPFAMRNSWAPRAVVLVVLSVVFFSDVAFGRPVPYPPPASRLPVSVIHHRSAFLLSIPADFCVLPQNSFYSGKY